MIDFGLKPCPLCGGEPTVARLTQGPGNLSAVIMCNDCGLTLNWETNIKVGVSRSGKKSEAKIGLDPIEAWNRRAGCEHCSIWKESDRIGALPNCNDCADRKTCKYVPKWGEIARINCPLWRAEQENNVEEPAHV